MNLRNGTEGSVTTHRAARTLWALYRLATPFQRSLAALRPFICPVNPILNSIPVGSTVFDVGCGNGLALALMASFKNVTRGVGVELNRRALDAAKAMSKNAGLPFTFFEAPTPGDWPKDLFEVVTMIDVLHHVPKTLREEFVSEALERVKPDGRFVYKDMVAAPWWRVAWNQVHDLILARQLVHVEPMENVVRWANSKGFYPTSTDSYVACALYGHELIVFQRKT